VDKSLFRIASTLARLNDAIEVLEDSSDELLSAAEILGIPELQAYAYTIRHCVGVFYALRERLAAIVTPVRVSEFTALPEERKYEIVHQMRERGGSFAQALADAWFKADSENRAKLEAAFPQLFDSYIRFVEGGDGR